MYGVVWPGGYGRVSGPPSVSGDDVSRTWRLLEGTAPSPGTKVALDGFAYPLKPPAGAKLVRYPSPRGDMPATYFPASGSTWAVLVHGKGATRAEMYRLAGITHRLGMPTLSIGTATTPTRRATPATGTPSASPSGTTSTAPFATPSGRVRPTSCSAARPWAAASWRRPADSADAEQVQSVV